MREPQSYTTDHSKVRHLSYLVAVLCILSPLMIGGAPSWALSICSIFSLYLLFILARSGLYLRSWGSVLFVGYWLSAFGAVISLVPLSPSTIKLLSDYTAQIWEQTSIVLQYEGITELTWRLSLTPVETIDWLCLQLTCLIVTYLTYHLHQQRWSILVAIALIGPFLVLLGFFHALFDFQKIYGLYQSLDRQYLKGFVTPIINHNTASSVLLMSAVCSFGVGLHYFQLRRVDDRHLKVWPWMTSVVISSIGVLSCGSRAGMCALLMGILLLYLRARKQLELQTSKWIWILGGFVLLIAMNLLEWRSLNNLFHRDITKQDLSYLLEDDAYPRFLVWEDCLTYLKHYGFWGTGRGSFGEVYMSLQSFSSRMWISSPESHPLQQVTEGGILGGIGGCLFPLWAWLVWWKRSLNQAHLSAFGIWIALAAVACHQLFDFGFEYAGLSIPIAALWGILWSYLPVIENRREQTLRIQSRTQRLLILSSIGLSSVLICSLHHQMTQANYRLRDAVRQTRLNTDLNHMKTFDYLSQHPASAHLALEVLLSRVKAWQRPLETELSDEQQSLLMKWLTLVKQRGPRLSTPYQVEGRLLASEGLFELAGLSYAQSINQAPWRFTELSKELIQFKSITPDLLIDKLQAPYLRVIKSEQGHLAMLQLIQLSSFWRSTLLDQGSIKRYGSKGVARIREEILATCSMPKFKQTPLCISLLREIQLSLKQWTPSEQSTLDQSLMLLDLLTVQSLLVGGHEKDTLYKERDDLSCALLQRHEHEKLVRRSQKWGIHPRCLKR